MNKIHYLHRKFLLILLLVSAVKVVKGQDFQPYKSGIISYHGYAYPIVPGTEAWKNIGHNQRVASMQLPADTLQNISTARLLETCLYYSFNIDIFALDDKIGGFGIIKSQFNGYAELYQRTDFVQQLMNLYASRNVAFINQIELGYDRGLYAFDFHVMEFMLTDAALLASDSQATQIATLLLEKEEQKTLYSVYGSSFPTVIALAIGRCLQRTNAFSDYQGTTLQIFLQSGKLMDINDIEYIIDKAKNLKN